MRNFVIQQPFTILKNYLENILVATYSLIKFYYKKKTFRKIINYLIFDKINKRGHI